MSPATEAGIPPCEIRDGARSQDAAHSRDAAHSQGTAEAALQTAHGQDVPGLSAGGSGDAHEPFFHPATPAAGAVPPVRVVEEFSLLQAFQSLLYVIVVALFIITFTVQPFRIPSESMEPTLLVGDFLLVNKQVGLEAPPHVLSTAGAIRRGDLIVFHYPVDPSMHLVKRVVGLPGDRLHMRDGHVYINGRELSEPYAIFRPASADAYRDDFPRLSSANPGVESRWWIQMQSLVSNGDLTIPPNDFFVLGDNRNDSEDSRYWGFVPRDAIVGKPFLVYFSLRDPDPTVGMGTHSPVASRHEGPLDSLLGFARWDRALHIIN